MTTLREALQTIAVLHDGDRPCDCEGHEMARAVALAPSEREQARDRVIAAAREWASGTNDCAAIAIYVALADLDRLSEPKP